jgi:hypothetical protein
MAIRKKINTINSEQTPPTQSSTQTHVDIWNSAMGDSLQFQYKNPRQSKTLQSILNAPWYMNIHMIHEDLQMNTVRSEIKKWNTKYLNKLENHTNALAVNLLDNSGTTHRLKRYTVLTLRTDLSKTPIQELKLYLSDKKTCMSYATGHNSFISQYLLNIYIYSRPCRLCVINVWKKTYGGII